MRIQPQTPLATRRSAEQTSKTAEKPTKTLQVEQGAISSGQDHKEKSPKSRRRQLPWWRPSNKPFLGRGGNPVQNPIAHSDSPQNFHTTLKVVKNAIAVAKICRTRDPPPCTFRYKESLQLPPQTVNVRELKELGFFFPSSSCLFQLLFLHLRLFKRLFFSFYFIKLLF